MKVFNRGKHKKRWTQKVLCVCPQWGLAKKVTFGDTTGLSVPKFDDTKARASYVEVNETQL